jgi:serine/threonine-protein kinase HipA
LNIPVIEVRAWGKQVGALARDPRLDYYAFAYAASWRRLGMELAPLNMPLSDTRQTFIFPNLPEATFRRLPAMFADALPDDFGNALIDAWMAERGKTKAAVTTLNRLAYMGKRGMGVLEFKPALGSHRESTEPLKMKSLVEEARKAVEGDLAADAHAKAALVRSFFGQRHWPRGRIVYDTTICTFLLYFVLVVL